MPNKLTIEQLKALCTDENIIITQHSLNRALQRSINYESIKAVIMNGDIIEDYPEDYPYPSCLILGLSDNNKELHVVAGIGEGKLWIITAYYPSLDKWEADYRTRKGVEKQ